MCAYVFVCAHGPLSYLLFCLLTRKSYLQETYPVPHARFLSTNIQYVMSRPLGETPDSRGEAEKKGNGIRNSENMETQGECFRTTETESRKASVSSVVRSDNKTNKEYEITQRISIHNCILIFTNSEQRRKVSSLVEIQFANVEGARKIEAIN